MLIHHDFVQEIVTLNTNTTQDCSALQIATIISVWPSCYAFTYRCTACMHYSSWFMLSCAGHQPKQPPAALITQHPAWPQHPEPRRALLLLNLQNPHKSRHKRIITGPTSLPPMAGLSGPPDVQVTWPGRGATQHAAAREAGRRAPRLPR